MSIEKNQIFERPSLQATATLLKDAIAKHRCIILVGHCRVDYKGRARSTLELGDRIVMIKEDGATLIHRPTGYKPVNWQSSNNYFRTNLIGESLVLHVIHRIHPESLKIVFYQVDIIMTMKMMDIGRFDLHVSEKEIQIAIQSHPDLLEKGFTPIAFEKKVEPGFLDLYGRDSSNRLVVVEIKRVRGGQSAVLQLARYVLDMRKTINPDIRGILVAPTISRGVQKLLATLNLEYKKINLESCAKVIERAQSNTMQHFF